MESLVCIVPGILLIMPIAIGGVLHMVIVRLGWFSSWAIPIDVKLFGKNKTYRGFMVMPLTCTIGVVLILLLIPHFFSEDLLARLSSLESFITDPNHLSRIMLAGPLLGFAYSLGELPNSFLKRRLGVPEGSLPQKGRWIFFILDHCDSAISCSLIYYIVFGVNLATLVSGIFIAIAVHTGLNIAMYLAGIRREPF